MEEVTDVCGLLRIPDTVRHYRFKHMIERGGFGIVVCVTDTNTNKDYAMKIMNRSQRSVQVLEQELRVHQYMKHPNIVELIEILYEPDQIYLVMELCRNGDLIQYMGQGKLKIENTILRAFSQIVSAVAYIHSKGICHLDIKPDNIMVDEFGNMKLGDFGCSQNIKYAGKMTNQTGTLCYAAPELIEDTPIEDKRACDIWSLGILLFSMKSSHLPWLPGDNDFITSQIRKGEISYPMLLGTEVTNVIKTCCKVSPDMRPSAEKLLEHPALAARLRAISSCVKFGLADLSQKIDSRSTNRLIVRPKGINFSLSNNVLKKKRLIY